MSDQDKGAESDGDKGAGNAFIDAIVEAATGGLSNPSSDNDDSDEDED